MSTDNEDNVVHIFGGRKLSPEEVRQSKGIWAEIDKEGKLVYFNEATCRHLASNWEKGDRNEIVMLAKLMCLILDAERTKNDKE